MESQSQQSGNLFTGNSAAECPERKKQLETLALISVELAKELQIQEQVRSDDVELLALRITTLEKQLATQKQKYQAEIDDIENQNQELISKLESKELAIKLLVYKNKELDKALRHKESLRLSQLESLACRNVKLERKVSNHPSDAGTEESDMHS